MRTGYSTTQPRLKGPRLAVQVAGAGLEPATSGFEPQPWGGGLKQDFQLFEGATRGSVSSSPTRLIRKCNSEGTS
jgi:hypothetical protein